MALIVKSLKLHIKVIKRIPQKPVVWIEAHIARAMYTPFSQVVFQLAIPNGSFRCGAGDAASAIAWTKAVLAKACCKIDLARAGPHLPDDGSFHILFSLRLGAASRGLLTRVPERAPRTRGNFSISRGKPRPHLSIRSHHYA